MQKKKVRSDLYVNCSVGILFFFLGFLIAKAIGFSQFKIEESINLIDVLSIFVTFFLVFFVTDRLEKRSGNNRNEKDLFINRASTINEMIIGLEEKVTTGSVVYVDAVSSLKRINTAFNSVFQTINSCHFSLTPEITTNLKSSFNKLRVCVTEIPRDDEVDVFVSVREGVIHYKDERLSVIEGNFEKLKSLLFELQIEINNK